MKKHLLATGVLVCILAFAAKTAHAQTISLDSAIRGAADEFSHNLGTGSRNAILSISSGSERLSNYLIEELASAIVSRRIFSVVDRVQLDLIREEMNFQMSGEVSDASAQAVGQKLGAQYIVTGTMEAVGGYYRFRVRVIVAETAVIRVSYSANVQNDQVITSLLESGSVNTPSMSEVYRDFTRTERWATFALNWLVPGLGSYVIMKDKVGGTIQVMTSGSGLIVFFVGGTVVANATTSPNNIIITTTIGAGLGLGSFVYNIVRSVSYHKPRPQIASLIDPLAWNIAVIPGKDGVEQVSLSYTLRF